MTCDHCGRSLNPNFGYALTVHAMLRGHRASVTVTACTKGCLHKAEIQASRYVREKVWLMASPQAVSVADPTVDPAFRAAVEQRGGLGQQAREAFERGYSGAATS